MEGGMEGGSEKEREGGREGCVYIVNVPKEYMIVKNENSVTE